jgi:hypothetical protein
MHPRRRHWSRAARRNAAIPRFRRLSAPIRPTGNDPSPSGPRRFAERSRYSKARSLQVEWYCWSSRAGVPQWIGTTATRTKRSERFGRGGNGPHLCGGRRVLTVPAEVAVSPLSPTVQPPYDNFRYRVGATVRRLVDNPPPQEHRNGNRLWSPPVCGPEKDR